MIFGRISSGMPTIILLQLSRAELFLALSRFIALLRSPYLLLQIFLHILIKTYLCAICGAFMYLFWALTLFYASLILVFSSTSLFSANLFLWLTRLTIICSKTAGSRASISSVSSVLFYELNSFFRFFFAPSPCFLGLIRRWWSTPILLTVKYV